MNFLLKLENICKSFDKIEVLKGLNFSVEEGEIISVLGPSGCGKSTLLQIIAGLQTPDKGTVYLQDEAVSSPHYVLPPEKRHINMVFQDFALWPHMNVFENIAYGLRRQRLSASEIQSRVSKLLELLYLSGLEKRLPSQLSGGQQQRIAIARALATRPSILLLDEPLSNLDVQLRAEMRSEMAYLFRKLGTTVFHVTHDPIEAFALANRLVIMDKGTIDQIAAPMECFKNPASPLVASILGAGNRLLGKAVAENNSVMINVGEQDCMTGMLQKHDVSNGARLEARFRPEDVHWCHSGQQEENMLHIQVIHSAFEGKQHRILAETKDGQRISFLHERYLEPKLGGLVMLPKTGLFLYPAL